MGMMDQPKLDLGKKKEDKNKWLKLTLRKLQFLLLFQFPCKKNLKKGGLSILELPNSNNLPSEGEIDVTLGRSNIDYSSVCIRRWYRKIIYNKVEIRSVEISSK